jgi:hypothetical protein
MKFFSSFVKEQDFCNETSEYYDKVTCYSAYIALESLSGLQYRFDLACSILPPLYAAQR